MRQTTRIMFGFLAVVAASSFSPETSSDDGDVSYGIVSEEVVPDLGDKKEWRCEDVTAQDDGVRCGTVHVCQSRHDANAMALQISLSWSRMPVYRIWGPVGKMHQSLRMLESSVWTPPLPGGKMECGLARDDMTTYIGILFVIYHEDDPDSWAAQAFFPIEVESSPAPSAHPLRRTSY